MRYWLPVLLYLTLIVTLSAQPGLKPPPQFELSDKFYHVLEYFGLGVLLARAFRAGRPVAAPMLTVAMVLTLGVMVGAADEIFQSYVPGRMSDIFDVLADGTGVLLAQLVFLLVVRD
jgi:VanZ family protein